MEFFLVGCEILFVGYLIGKISGVVEFMKFLLVVSLLKVSVGWVCLGWYFSVM